jgi:hypothetical protein
MKQILLPFLKGNYEATNTLQAAYFIKPKKIKRNLIALLSKYVVLHHCIQQENKFKVMNFCDLKIQKIWVNISFHFALHSF